MYLKPIPPGVMPLDPADRQPIVNLTGGDSCVLDLSLHLPGHPDSPATPETTFATAVLSENRFADPIWIGSWFNGIQPDADRKGLVHLRIPDEVTQALRRGSYALSVRVTDMLGENLETEARATILVEYEPTSDQHSIPYRDGTTANSENGILVGSNPVAS